MIEMKVLIAYFSQTGNTAKVARAIHEEVASQGHEVHLREIGEITSADLNAYDLVLVGSACHDTDLARPAKGILYGITNAPSFKLAGFVTHATLMPEGGKREKEFYERWAANCARSFLQSSQDRQIDFLGFFSCRGAPSPAIEEFIHDTIITDKDEWEAYIEELRQHPDEQDLLDAKNFASQVLAKC
jgi:flavodoxin